MKIKTYLELVRFKNLMLLAFALLVLRYGFLNLQNIPLALSTFNYILLIISVTFIAAAGYVINDIFDQNTDIINKPQKAMVGHRISEAKAYNMYVTLNVLGVFIGFYLSNVISKPGFAAIFIATAFCLYLYATTLKQMMLVGNIIVAFFTAFPIILVGIFDLFPIINAENQAVQSIYFKLLLDYAIFAFMINFIREMVKDMQDIPGDQLADMQTFPIVAGIATARITVVVISIISAGIMLYYTYDNYFTNNLFYATAYVLLFVLTPFIVFTINIYSASTPKSFGQLSQLLKVIMFFGMVSSFVVTLNILYNA